MTIKFTLKAAFAGVCALAVHAAYADVTIGFTGPLSGPVAAVGQDQYDGFMLGIEQLGTKLGGQNVKVLREDDQLKPELGNQIARKLIDRDKVDAIVGLGFSNVLMAQSFMANKLDILPLIKSVVKNTFIGAKEIISIYEASKKIVSKFHEHQQEMTNDERKTLADYMGTFEQKKGSVRENDEITNLIKVFLSRIKSKRKNKQFVLVIDDLDRLDPEQICRLFNIFTAHHDSRKDSNKFGFDKVIFICDLNNIECLFRHKYGPTFSFDGYIDKFYSYKPFFFNHRQFLKEKASQYFINSLDLGQEFEEFSEHSFLAELFGQKGDFFDLMVRFSNRMVDNGLLRTRNFQKFRSFYLPRYKVKIGHKEHEAVSFPLLVLFSLMKQFYPRTEDFLSAIQILKANFESNYEIRSDRSSIIWENLLISYSIPFLEDRLHEKNYHREKPNFVAVKNEFGEPLFLEYQVDRHQRFEYLHFHFTKAVKTDTLTNGRSTDDAVASPNPYHFLEQALRSCLKNGYIKN